MYRYHYHIGLMRLGRLFILEITFLCQFSNFSLPSWNCLKKHQITLIFMYLGVFVILVFAFMPKLNLMPNLFHVYFEVILIIKVPICVMIMFLADYMFLNVCCLLRINFKVPQNLLLYLIHLDTCGIILILSQWIPVI